MSTFERVVRLATQFLGAPVSLLSLVRPDKQTFISALGLQEPWASKMETPLSHSFCKHVVETDAPLRLRDARQDPLHSSNLSIPDLGIVSYLGVPLKDETSATIGALCVVDYEPREWSDDQVKVLEDLSGIATTEIERIQAEHELQEASKELTHQAALLRSFFDTAPLMMGVVQVQPGVIIHRLDNAAAARFLGIRPDRLKDRKVSDTGATPEAIELWTTAYQTTIETQEPVQFDYVVDRCSETQTLAVTVSCVGMGPDGYPICSYVCDDVTARRSAEDRLRTSEQDLQLALTAGRMGVWKGDYVHNRVMLSDELCRMYQIEKRERTLDEGIEMVDERDIEQLHSTFRAAVKRTGKTGVEQDISMDYRVPVNGEVRWFRTACRIYPGAAQRAATVAGTVIDVTAEREHMRALIEAREQARKAEYEAEAAARLRQSILHNMSHEIRTPLTAVIGFADLMSDEVTGDAAEYVQYIQSASGQLLNTLNSVLAHARLEAGHGATKEGDAIQSTPLNVSDLVSTTLDLFRHRAADQGLSLNCSSEEDAVWALADPGGVQRVLTNLISNAVKFTDSGSISVHLATERMAPLQNDQTSGEVVITIRDTGIGMNDSFLARAFEPFHQESEGTARSHEGTGLGLAIVRRLVEMMDGSVSVTSQLGVGSTFTVRLPAAEPEPYAVA